MSEKVEPDKMLAGIARMAAFLADIPLVKWNPSTLEIISSDTFLRGWRVAGEQGGLSWIQDYTMEGKMIEEVRTYTDKRSGVTVAIAGLKEGVHILTPFETWKGVFLVPLEVACGGSGSCAAALPDFRADMAFRLTRT